MFVRTRTPELMDQPGLDPDEHGAALAGLARINRFSGSAGILWRALRSHSTRADQPLHVLDVATGAGDLPVRLLLLARAARLPLAVSACDVSAEALDHAARRAARCGVRIDLFRHDAVAAPFPTVYDVTISSLFLHHLAEDQAVTLLRNMAAAARRALLINDLRRCRTGLWLAAIGTRLLSRSRIVHVDGPRSVHNAYTPAEALALARAAGLERATAACRFPCRFLLEWRRS